MTVFYFKQVLQGVEASVKWEGRGLASDTSAIHAYLAKATVATHY